MDNSLLKPTIGISLVLYSCSLLMLILIAEHTSPSFLLNKTLTAKLSLPDFAAISDVKEKKSQFFAYLRPMAETENNKITVERKALLKIKERWAKSQKLSRTQKKHLKNLVEKYKVTQGLSINNQLSQLLVKVDSIPTSLILVQAANESAWGTSRFAREGNNLFGLWCFNKGCGMVPAKRTEGAHYEVSSFSSPVASVTAYCHNLNSHDAYQLLRQIRAQLKVHHHTATGHALAGGLISYSERGKGYVEELRSMIRNNNLE